MIDRKPRGLKPCPDCKKKCGSRTLKCECGFMFGYEKPHPDIIKCRKCGIEKRQEEFPLRKSGRRDKLCRACKSQVCREYNKSPKGKAAAKRYRDEHKASVTKISKKSQEKHRFRLSLKNIARHAIKNGYAPCIATKEEIREAFTGKCHACGVPECECKTRLHADHCHITGRFRGWLCGDCNIALGLLKDSAERARLLAEYVTNRSSYC